ncbi:MAG: hypothetical protein ACK5MT_17015 [Actinomycetales bacterium]
MTRTPVLVWGSCWFDEEPAVLVKTARAIEHAISVLDMRVISVVFDARHDRLSEARQVLVSNGIDVLSHDVAAYPNKNLGVAMITAFAGEREADVVAVVDPDWALDDVDQFVLDSWAPCAVLKQQASCLTSARGQAVRTGLSVSLRCGFSVLGCGMW